MDPILIGNAIALVGALLMVAGGFLTRRKHILLAQSAQFTVQAFSNFILGGLSGSVSNVLSLARNLFCLDHRLSPALAVGFIAVQTAITLVVDRTGWLLWLPILATAAFTFTINSKNEILLKSAVIFGLLCWTVYDLSLHNYVSTAFDLFGVGSNLLGILAIWRGAKQRKNSGA